MLQLRPSQCSTSGCEVLPIVDAPTAHASSEEMAATLLR